MHASKNPKKPMVQAVQALRWFKPFKSLEAFRAQKIAPIQTFLAQEIVEDRPVRPLAVRPAVKETINNDSLVFPLRTRTMRKRN
jgi:hypothetical protein